MALPGNVEIFVMLALFCCCSGSEPQCSRYHYEEQILAKVLRLEQKLDILDETKVPMLIQCPDGWVPFRKSCYSFADEKSTHQNARLNCLLKDAYLVHVNDEEESAFLSMYLRKFKDNQYWIGLTDLKIEGQFKWDGQDTTPSFTNWITGQPDNSGGKENCVHINHSYDYRWNDNVCSALFMFICEKRKTQTSVSPNNY